MVKVRQAPCLKLPFVGKLGLNPRNVVGECSREIPGVGRDSLRDRSWNK